MSNLAFVVGDKTLETVATKDKDDISVKIGSNDYLFHPIGESLFQLQFDGKTHIVAAIKYKDVYYIDIDSTVIEVRELGANQNYLVDSSQNSTKDKVFAPMPGKIVKILVKQGDAVTEKQPLAVVEAMKMENQVYSPASGKVKAVNFSVGEQVNTTSPIIELTLEQSD